jgi:hypothetical protein
MAIALMMDHHVSQEITDGLRGRGIDVLIAADDGSQELPDPSCSTGRRPSAGRSSPKTDIW